MNEKIAIVGGGPAALLIYKRFVESGAANLSIDIFEATNKLGSGMPYSTLGAEMEHVTNVSADELPDLVMPLADWVKSLPAETLKEFGINLQDFHEKKVLPRLLFGQYLTAQFNALLDQAKNDRLDTRVHYGTSVCDIRNDDLAKKVLVTTRAGATAAFDRVIICSGHHWPAKREGKVPGYFDSPYPPSKLAAHFDHAVVVRGSSLTAVDAIRTTARSNGSFAWERSRLVYHVNADSQNFRIVMHSRNGLLPCIRVHMEEPHVAGSPLISDEEINQNRQSNDGFLELDFLFEYGFKLPLKDSDNKFYDLIKDMSLESFVEAMMNYREAMAPFELFKQEYLESKKSIRQEKPVYWKEMLSALSFAMNYPAKYLSAEDMLRLQKHLMPLISVVIAFLPQSSCEELLALHDAGRLDLVDDGDGGTAEISKDGDIVYKYEDESGDHHEELCKTFIDCVGQPHLSIDSFPFQSLVKDGTISSARLKFRSASTAEKLMAQGEADVIELDGIFYLRVSGADISDSFQVINTHGDPSARIYLMAVPYMGGLNPDYSGLDFCEHASELIVESILAANSGKDADLVAIDG